MEVFLVPVGLGRHELYCEVRDESEEGASIEPSGRVERMRLKLRAMMAEAESVSRSGAPDPVDAERTWTHRMQRRMLRWVAEKVAEQKLLWHLRRQSAATLVFPEDMHEGDAMRILRGFLERDLRIHRRWLVFDSMLLVASTALVFLPGPNFVAYYFLFRVVGHYLSMRGARQGLRHVEWQTRPSAPLTDLRRVATLDPAVRDEHVQHVASELQLQHLAQFFQRTAVMS